MTRYQKVIWRHDDDDYPILLYSEVQDFGIESRKVEVYADGRQDYADDMRSIGSTILSQEPLPSIEEIEDQAEFSLSVISCDEFERVWHEAAEGPVD